MTTGTRPGRADAPAKAAGRALYTEDLQPRGLLHAAVVRSPVASARIAGVEVDEARAVEGVACVLTAADLPDRRWGTARHDQPILARDVVRFAGEPIALVAAETKAAAARAAALIRVDLEPLPAVIDLEAAMADDAPRVHADAPNLSEPARVRRGDVDAALQAAAQVVTTRVRTHRVHQGYIEPRVALAEPDDAGGLVVTMTSQSPFVVRQGLAALLDLPMARVVVKVPTLGGGFGGKLHLGLAPLAAVLCLRTGRPVQVVNTREDDMRAGNPREGSIVELTSAVDADGRILARRARVYLDSGAYAFDTPMIASIAALQGTGPYDVEHVDLEASYVASHTCPTGSFRGPSGPEMVFATESHVEEIAAAAGLSVLEVRRRNLLRSGVRGPSGELLPDVGMEDCLDVAVRRLDEWRAAAPPPAPGRRRGFGLACAWWLTAPTPSAATIALDEDGSATVTTGATEIGTGAVLTGAAALAADAIGIDPARVRVVSGSTGDGPYDGGSKGSRTLYGVGNAVLRAADEVVELLKEEAATQLEAATEDLVIADGGVAVRGSPSASRTIAELAQGALNRTGPIVGRGRFRAQRPILEGAELERMPFDAFNEATFHCHAVEIELDEETGRIEVARYLAVHDVGPILDREGARGQVEGGVVQGLGYALTEHLEVDEQGLVRNADLVDYRLPTITDAPRELDVVFVESHPGPSGPRGAKGIGEAPVIVPAAAVGSALRDALGAQPLALPFDATRVADFLDGGVDNPPRRR